MRQIVIFGLLLIFFAGCQRTPASSTQPTSGSPPSSIMEPPGATGSTAPATVAASKPENVTPLPEGTDVSYQCADGNEVTVTYTYVSARLRWPDGRKLNLSRTAFLSKGVEVYAGNRASLQHDGAVMHLSQDGGAAVTCSEASSSA